MQRAVICKGDPTSHGGQVLEGSETATIDGKPIALLGHMTFCPQCKGKFPIIEGLDFHTFAGLGTVVDGMKTGCGATLTATQNRMFIDIGGAADRSDSADNLTGSTHKEGQYTASFRAVDEETGAAVSGLAYRIGLPDGESLRGVTDADGNTERVVGHDPATITLHWEVEAPMDIDESGAGT
ncbi:PAAR domain-containing protein [Duganella violaceipulchra]|uniref:PAAR domain-containing protein n=1 Tax=Duganella violaceipulchra TaxID=2849652 RepID=A0AA41H5S3_9BURK|nr:PAAR domain-containing protein [Duganella violaceicalia]MBV6322323.1 PAAR domain-containing protein [Duganella violaceicalia]MCP2011470.1 putative Zn-binding protein involved in type VI secretion [Duganella violaceicalia]